MHKIRINYWSLSEFAKRILKKHQIPTPFALSMEEWKEYHEQYDKRWPMRLVKSFDVVQDIVMFPADLLNTVTSWLSNCWLNTHLINTGLSRGTYYDLDYKILHGLMTELVDLVEIEWASCCVDKPTLKWYQKVRHIRKFFPYRDPDAGMKYIQLQLEGKANTEAMEAIRDIYYWWKYMRPLRLDPNTREVSGDIYDCFIKQPGDDEYYKKVFKIEKLYEDEDTEYLTKLIKYRKMLWS